VLVFVDWDLYSYSRMSSARRALRRRIEPYVDKIRDDYLNLLIIDVRRGVEDVLGEILSGLVFGLSVSSLILTGNTGLSCLSPG
ncbi:MAG: hypothetical protein GSR72_02500, partial [Desulfurococcales archaeon]|nr:hypothetical protein [Desulfurococcales archaeon]